MPKDFKGCVQYKLLTIYQYVQVRTNHGIAFPITYLASSLNMQGSLS